MLLTKDNLENFEEWLAHSRDFGGTILINKDLNWTSFDVVAKLRRITNIRKIGHAGTLDPLATGLLILCLGKNTKKINEYQDKEKEYSALVKFGATTNTNDSEGEEENIKEVNFSRNALENALQNFRGEIEQIPPMFSAKKVEGKRLYKLARKSIELELKPVKVTINSLELVSFESPIAELLINCSKGTYIRALARDLGNYLETGAYLSALKRTKIGEFSVDSAIRIDELMDLAQK
jgi:tRNA pseudouridine55 synthase